MEAGDVCMYEIQYTQTDNNLKIWIDSATNMEITVVDGLSTHPYQITGTMNYFPKLMYEGDEFEVGDYWYEQKNMTFGGKAYLFLKSTETYGYATFTYG